VGAFQVNRVVIDTNVLVSGLLFGGAPGEIVNAWKEGRIQPICSAEIVEEYLKVLAYPKFRLSEEEIDFLVTNEILPFFEVVEVKSGRSYVKKDPSDDKFVRCAVAGRARAIISRDEHLLGLVRSPVPVVSPVEFLSNK
jgi:putative PIN family toxin of toxin-antitoxin system